MMGHIFKPDVFGHIGNKQCRPSKGNRSEDDRPIGDFSLGFSLKEFDVGDGNRIGSKHPDDCDTKESIDIHG